MGLHKHFRLFAIASFAWLAFWIVGLPDYYRQYSGNFMLWVVLLLLPPLESIITLTLRRVHLRRRLIVACWVAFCFTVPLAIYDWLYCGVYRGYGLRFLVDFWYLTFYYIIPWLLLPASALLLNRLRSKQNTEGGPGRPISVADKSHDANDITK